MASEVSMPEWPALVVVPLDACRRDSCRSVSRGADLGSTVPGRLTGSVRSGCSSASSAQTSFMSISRMSPVICSTAWSEEALLRCSGGRDRASASSTSSLDGGGESGLPRPELSLSKAPESTSPEGACGGAPPLCCGPWLCLCPAGVSEPSSEPEEEPLARSSSSALLLASSASLRFASSQAALLASFSARLSSSSETPDALARFFASLTMSFATNIADSVVVAACRSTLSTVKHRSLKESRAAWPSVQSNARRSTRCTPPKSRCFTPHCARMDLIMPSSFRASASFTSRSSLRESLSSEMCRRCWAPLLALTLCLTPSSSSRWPVQEGLRNLFSTHATSRLATLHSRPWLRHWTESKKTPRRETSTTPSTGGSASAGAMRPRAFSSTSSSSSRPGS
mmetsp:Transcript_73663/g.216137  ORF Transcript_73663/g.216137 Transcript_73663/m.216137 type:complete len:397 (+) Transcript_73663:757-1947(+)